MSTQRSPPVLPAHANTKRAKHRLAHNKLPRGLSKCYYALIARSGKCRLRAATLRPVAAVAAATMSIGSTRRKLSSSSTSASSNTRRALGSRGSSCASSCSLASYVAVEHASNFEAKWPASQSTSSLAAAPCSSAATLGAAAASAVNLSAWAPSDSLAARLAASGNVCKNTQRLAHVVDEMCSSEAKFVDTLRLLNVDFREFVRSSLAGEARLRFDQMLKHLPPLQSFNESLLEELEKARNDWISTQKIAHVLVKLGPFLKLYSAYIREFTYMQAQFDECMRKYSGFHERVRDFESSQRSQRLRVHDHLLKPIQRIPQYRLLMRQYLHHLRPSDPDYEDTLSALEVVSRVAEHANQSMNEAKIMLHHRPQRAMSHTNST